MEISELHELDRRRTVTIGDLIGIARDLIEPVSRPRAGNPEYERAITELISIAAGIPEEGRDLVTGALGIREEVSARQPDTADVRLHSSDDMMGREFRDVLEPVAVVLRRDGSVDVYGYVAVVDQRPPD